MNVTSVYAGMISKEAVHGKICYPIKIYFNLSGEKEEFLLRAMYNHEKEKIENGTIFRFTEGDVNIDSSLNKESTRKTILEKIHQKIKIKLLFSYFSIKNTPLYTCKKCFIKSTKKTEIFKNDKCLNCIGEMDHLIKTVINLKPTLINQEI